jgi:hypothetical protein
MRARRIELGAGIAGCALSLLAFFFVIFAPIVPVCASPAQHCPKNSPRYVTMIQGSPGPDVWLFVLAMLALSLAGGLGAIVEARTSRRMAALPLWVATVLVFGGCALTASGVGIIYLPSALALGLAAYASLLSRFQVRHQQVTTGDQ